MFRKDLLAIGGFEGLKYPEDYDLFFRWLNAGYDFSFTEELCLLWRDHERRSSRTRLFYQQSAFFSLKIDFFLDFLDQAKKPLLILGSNRKAQLTMQILKRRGRSFAQVVLKPKKVKGKGHPVLRWSQIEEIGDPLLLCTVYPEKTEREKIKEALLTLNLREGKHWWYL